MADQPRDASGRYTKNTFGNRFRQGMREFMPEAKDAFLRGAFPNVMNEVDNLRAKREERKKQQRSTRDTNTFNRAFSKSQKEIKDVMMKLHSTQLKTNAILTKSLNVQEKQLKLFQDLKKSGGLGGGKGGVGLLDLLGAAAGVGGLGGLAKGAKGAARGAGRLLMSRGGIAGLGALGAHYLDKNTNKPGNSNIGSWINENIPGMASIDDWFYNITGGAVGTSKKDPRYSWNKNKNNINKQNDSTLKTSKELEKYTFKTKNLVFDAEKIEFKGPVVLGGGGTGGRTGGGSTNQKTGSAVEKAFTPGGTTNMKVSGTGNALSAIRSATGSKPNAAAAGNFLPAPHIANAKSGRDAAEQYLGKKMSDQEWDYLVRATHAEAGAKGDPKELGMVMGSILNRARTHQGGIIGALKAKNQFQAVTGTKYQPGPSRNFQQGPNQNRMQQIQSAAMNVLPRVSRSQKNFTAASAAAYGPGTNIGYRNNMLAGGGTTYGGSVFNTSLLSAGATSGVTPAQQKAQSNPNQVIADVASGKTSANSPIVKEALSVLGLNENRDRQALIQFMNGKVDPARTAWCAAFVNASLARAGVKGTGSLAAGSYSAWGSKVSNPQNVQAGDVVVNRRRSPRTGLIGSHVEIATGPAYKDSRGRWIVPTIGGNVDNSVSRGTAEFSSHNIRRALPSSYTSKYAAAIKDLPASGSREVSGKLPKHLEQAIKQAAGPTPSYKPGYAGDMAAETYMADSTPAAKPASKPAAAPAKATKTSKTKKSSPRKWVTTGLSPYDKLAAERMKFINRYNEEGNYADLLRADALWKKMQGASKDAPGKWVGGGKTATKASAPATMPLPPPRPKDRTVQQAYKAGLKKWGDSVAARESIRAAGADAARDPYNDPIDFDREMALDAKRTNLENARKIINEAVGKPQLPGTVAGFKTPRDRANKTGSSVRRSGKELVYAKMAALEDMRITKANDIWSGLGGVVDDQHIRNAKANDIWSGLGGVVSKEKGDNARKQYALRFSNRKLRYQQDMLEKGISGDDNSLPNIQNNPDPKVPTNQLYIQEQAELSAKRYAESDAGQREDALKAVGRKFRGGGRRDDLDDNAGWVEEYGKKTDPEIENIFKAWAKDPHGMAF